uniref:Uncharacterized protein n=1 Tax=Romanomermis culicivorax TaxID=13658 RepID=A0A915HJA2_ROMCU
MSKAVGFYAVTPVDYIQTKTCISVIYSGKFALPDFSNEISAEFDSHQDLRGQRMFFLAFVKQRTSRKKSIDKKFFWLVLGNDESSCWSRNLYFLVVA